ncbi:MAG: hypothetical protein KJN64_05080 [Ignavibacteria bacterium]|nr:hypothetical protein [Ignavibacteria bacterium]
MNTGQMIMSMGAMVLFSTVMLRVNTSNLLNEAIRDEAQYGVLATSIATSIIEQATSKSFDENSDSTSVSNLSELTLSSNLGPDAGEDYRTFDDFDDFDGFTHRDSTMPSAVFDIVCSVNYVESSNIKSTTTNLTWHKKIDITVSSPFSQDTFRTSSIYSYWNFR